MRNLLLFLVIGCTSLTLQAQDKKIIFLSGPKDHGFPGRHEYVKSLQLLEKSLVESSNVEGIATEFYVGPAPRDLSIYDDADAIVILSSSDRSAREVHPLFPPYPETVENTYDYETREFLKGIDERIKNGMGIVILHYAVWAEHWTAREYYMDWSGGLWVQIPSKNPNDNWDIVPEEVDHPILNGVEPWNFREEIFSRFFLPDHVEGRTSLLLGTPERFDIGQQVVAWSYEPNESQRAFVFGGIDYHDNLYLDVHRKFILNGIAWAAGIEIPAEGVESVAVKPDGE